MIFPSYIFIFIFLPIVLCLWKCHLNPNYRFILLTLVSYIFYGWWDYRFVLLLIFSTSIDYFCGKNIYKCKASGKRGLKWLTLSLTTNLSVLFFFKYYDFFISSVAGGLNNLGFGVQFELLELVLPLGISFYTFQSMSYSIDIYHAKANPAKNFFSFSAYVSMFPQLVAGPIVRYATMAKQLEEHHKGPNIHLLRCGCWLFIIGLAKKILLADPLAPLVSSVFDSPEKLYFATAWAGTLAYTLQLYFDFSGYSDMAIGLGLLLGFNFPINFSSPYKSGDISEFWKRWHITLSSFLRDYLYIPLGGSRVSKWLTFRNLAITMFLGGLWHGAAWTFVIWGCYHGILLITHALWKSTKIALPYIIAMPITFVSVCFGWVIFRAPSIEKAGEIFLALIGVNKLSPSWTETYTTRLGDTPLFFAENGGLDTFAIAIIGLLIVFLAPASHDIKAREGIVAGGICGALSVYLVLLLSKETPFLYFQF